MILQKGSEPVLIQRKLIVFGAIHTGQLIIYVHLVELGLHQDYLEILLASRTRHRNG